MPKSKCKKIPNFTNYDLAALDCSLGTPKMLVKHVVVTKGFFKLMAFFSTSERRYVPLSHLCCCAEVAEHTIRSNSSMWWIGTRS